MCEVVILAGDQSILSLPVSPQNESIHSTVHSAFYSRPFFREKNGIANACVINFPSVLLYHGMHKYDKTRPSLDFFDVERTRSGSSHHIFAVSILGRKMLL